MLTLVSLVYFLSVPLRIWSVKQILLSISLIPVTIPLNKENQHAKKRTGYWFSCASIRPSPSHDIINPAPGPRGSPAAIHRISSSDHPIRKQIQYGSMVDTSVPIPELSSYFFANTTTMAK